MCWRLLKHLEMPTLKLPIDKIGLLLLVVWVAALQIMLDEGKDHDWFESSRIIVLAIVAAIGFVSFLIWELTERNPVVAARCQKLGIECVQGLEDKLATLTALAARHRATELSQAELATRIGVTYRRRFALASGRLP